MTNTDLGTEHSRYFEVDVLRGLAIVLMVLFHFGYDLTVFGWASYNTNQDMEWKVFRVIIVSGFLLAVGMSSYLAYSRKINKIKLSKGVAKLALVALFLSISSFFMDPSAWVYFGIIHFIAIALPLSVLFVRIPNIAAGLGCLIILFYAAGILNLDLVWEWSVANIGIPKVTLDVVSFFPWFGVVLIGIYLMHNHLFNLKINENTFSSKLSYLGRHSLVIYLIHQPVLYAILFSVELFRA